MLHNQKKLRKHVKPSKKKDKRYFFYVCTLLYVLYYIYNHMFTTIAATDHEVKYSYHHKYKVKNTSNRINLSNSKVNTNSPYEFTPILTLTLFSGQHDYTKGAVQKCLDHYFQTDVLHSLSYKIDLYIYFNKGQVKDYADLIDRYISHPNINTVNIYSHHLSGYDDLYARTPNELLGLNLEVVAPLGGSSGPNNLFYKSMDHISSYQYQYIFMIEWDTYPIQQYWIDQMISYCLHNQFLIAGSHYKGKNPLSGFEAWSGHLNGVAIYRNCDMLRILLNKSEELIKYYVRTGVNLHVNFDIAIHYYKFTLMGQELFNNRDFPENHLIDCPIIQNYSLGVDKNTPVNEILKQHPQTIIVHQKPSKQKKKK